MMNFMAGPKLIKQSVKRTRRHIIRQEVGETELASMLKNGASNYRLPAYLIDERIILKSLEKLNEANSGQ